MYLGFKNLKKTRKNGNKSNEKRETSTTDAFGVWSSGNTVCLKRLKCIKLRPAKVFTRFETRKKVWFMFLKATWMEERYS